MINYIKKNLGIILYIKNIEKLPESPLLYIIIPKNSGKERKINCYNLRIKYLLHFFR